MGGYPAPPQPPPGYGPPPLDAGGARCVMGHAIPPGGSYCLEGGHPIAMEQGHGDALGATAFAPPPPAPPPNPYGPPPELPKPPPAAGTPARSGGTSAKTAERRALAGFLVSYQDDALGKFWPLYQGRNLVGRAETGQDVDVPIGHGTTSTRHAQIDCDGGRFIITDMGSTNGTFHNEDAIGFQGKRELRDGDKLRFGGYTVVVFNAAARCA